MRGLRTSVPSNNDGGMVRIPCDCNEREDTRTLVVSEEHVIKHALTPGDRVLLHEPGAEYVAVLRRGQIWPWVADIIEIRDVPYEETPPT